ncbi:hypothetical protein QSV34_14495 [Porticoccus sp. W117]|uniref:hypothetical protein n=1 Tax=Porticoccus sp. W117 TaxID=3054777 RepID=UPI00259565CD|nr:hypothetical protein [Porticoccus sp. W117]MDM3872559.1 hypothetical protein [Porticoccus sp. W117]
MLDYPPGAATAEAVTDIDWWLIPPKNRPKVTSRHMTGEALGRFSLLINQKVRATPPIVMTGSKLRPSTGFFILIKNFEHTIHKLEGIVKWEKENGIS